MTADVDRKKMPEPEAGGLIKTLNNMGYMTSDLDPYSRSYVAFAGLALGPALEIGAAYGVATIEALAAGAEVIANDIDARHLEILESRVAAHQRGRLTLMPGEFPDSLSIAPESLGAVLVARVLHFFDGPTIERSAATIYNWLKTGGQVFIVAETPYLKSWTSFIPVYEARRQAGERWPGFNGNLTGHETKRSEFLPKQLHHLDPEVLTRTFKEAGFEVLESATFGRPDFPDDIRLDGRESCGLIARKN